MIDWGVIVICVLFLGFIGCRGVDRLTGTGKDEPNIPKITYVTNSQSPVYITFAGVFTDDNFVELKDVPKYKYKDIYVDLIRDEKPIQLGNYTKERDEAGHPYYMESGAGGLNFFNIKYGDEYQIFVYK